MTLSTSSGRSPNIPRDAAVQGYAMNGRCSVPATKHRSHLDFPSDVLRKSWKLAGYFPSRLDRMAAELPLQPPQWCTTERLRSVRRFDTFMANLIEDWEMWVTH